VLRELWHPPGDGHPFRHLADDAAGWATEIPQTWEAAGRPYEAELAQLAGRLAGELATTQGHTVVLHQDLHGGNILRAERQPLLAIDPKPLVGEREFDLASLIRDRRETITEATVRRRLDLLSDELGLDRERMRDWAIVHALAWGVDTNGADEAMVNCARWLAGA
jgi:streptomycin 6-kinase